MPQISDFTDQQVIAKTAWGEARGAGRDGMQSVINVIVNRANNPSWWGKDLRSVCLFPSQFDCWMPSSGDDYISTMNVTESDQNYSIALDLASQAIAGTLPDLTSGATYYYAKSMETPPYWAEGHTPCADIGGQLFFNDIS